MPVLSVMMQLCLWAMMFGTADKGLQVGVWRARWGCTAMSSTRLGRSGHKSGTGWLQGNAWIKCLLITSLGSLHPWQQTVCRGSLRAHVAHMISPRPHTVLGMTPVSQPHRTLPLATVSSPETLPPPKRTAASSWQVTQVRTIKYKRSGPGWWAKHRGGKAATHTLWGGDREKGHPC